ncbi:MAG: sulfotransferase [Bacteroidia bacterium]
MGNIKKSMISDKQFVFIIGAPRSGSTWLHHLLAAHSKVAASNEELTIFNSYIIPWIRNFEKEEIASREGNSKQGLPHLWSREKLDEQINNFLENIYSTFAITSQHEIILDKQPNYSFYVDVIHYYFPEAKFIHIIRDGRDAAYSWNRVWYKAGFGNPSFYGACTDWLKYKNAAHKAKELYPENYLEVRYENLLKNTSEELMRILDFCGVKAFPEEIKNIVDANTDEKKLVHFPDEKISYQDRMTKKDLWKIKLSKEEQYLAKKIMGDELIKEKYERDRQWGAPRITTFLFFIKWKIKSVSMRIENAGKVLFFNQKS